MPRVKMQANSIELKNPMEASNHKGKVSLHWAHLNEEYKINKTKETIEQTVISCLGLILNKKAAPMNLPTKKPSQLN